MQCVVDHIQNLHKQSIECTSKHTGSPWVLFFNYHLCMHTELSGSHTEIELCQFLISIGMEGCNATEISRHADYIKMSGSVGVSCAIAMLILVSNSVINTTKWYDMEPFLPADTKLVDLAGFFIISSTIRILT